LRGQSAATVLADDVLDVTVEHMKDASVWLLKLRRLLRSRGRTTDQADELIQEAFVRLQIYCQEHEVAQPEAFLVRTTLNLMVDETRKVAAGPELQSGIEHMKLEDPYPIPEEVLIEQQQVIHLGRGLDRLSPRVREVFLLHRMEGASYAQIAEHLNLSARTVEKHVAKASLFLIAWMAKEPLP
jgi:RNA polymerase sigma-70 factor (ECF subfamily)